MDASANTKAAPPPYTPSRAYPMPTGRPNLGQLPLPILFRIVSLTLDPRATPSRWMSDEEEEKVRRVSGLFWGLRGVSRSFWLVATSILRSRYHPQYIKLVQRGYSSDAYPFTSHPSVFGTIDLPRDSKSPSGGSNTLSSGASVSVYDGRSRETAVLDRFIAFKVGDELRKVESSLTEDTGEEKEIFSRFQPVARIEDLLLTLPSHIISPHLPPTLPPDGSIPLPHACLSVILTPGWAQLYLWSKPYGSRGAGRDMVVEVRRGDTLEATVRVLGEAVTDMGRGMVQWGARVY